MVRTTVGIAANFLQPSNPELLQGVGNRPANAGMVLVIIDAVQPNMIAV